MLTILTPLKGSFQSFTAIYSSKVPAGFPSPADDHIEGKLDLNEFLIKRPAATFIVRASGHSMEPAGIYSDDLLIVDKSLTPVHGDIVIAAVSGELTVKRLSIKGNHVQLLADNTVYPPITITESDDLFIWGVVTYVIHSTRR